MLDVECSVRGCPETFVQKVKTIIDFLWLDEEEEDDTYLYQSSFTNKDMMTSCWPIHDKIYR